MAIKEHRVFWSKLALENLDEIVAYVEQFNPAAAIRLGERLTRLGDGLAVFSNRGKAVQGSIREISNVWPYIIRYGVTGDSVDIIRIRHGARLQND